MKFYRPLICFLLLFTSITKHSLADTSKVPDSITPNPRMVNYPWMSLSKWYEMHAADVAIATEGAAPIVFIGDSITEGWNGNGQTLWEKHFAPLGAANFGIGGDTTQNLLWRLNYGATGKLDPKGVILLIGTNNFAFTKDRPETIAAGVIAVVDTLTASYPNANILLMGVFPRGETKNFKFRPGIDRINRIISQLESRDRVTYLDITSALLEPDESLSKVVMPDFLHLSEDGYRRWAKAILPWISEQLASP